MTDADSPPPIFLTPGASPEAQALLDRWNEQWPGMHPWRRAPRQERPDGWVRFHTLANGRQEFRNARDARTARRRVTHVVRSVEYLTGLPVGVLIVADDSSDEYFRTRVRSVIPDLEP